jgi:hypothetical protein
MTYLKVVWRHDHPDYPVLLYSELDEERWEVRKVEVFKNGKLGYASKEAKSANTFFGELPVPSFEDIAKNNEFEPTLISKEEFESTWDSAIAKPKNSRSN